MSQRGPAAGAPARERLGIEALDALLDGGLPAGNTVLVQGAPGTGKTVLALQLLNAGATQLDAPGLLVTFEEHPTRLFRDAQALGWDFERLERERRLLIVFTSPGVFLKELESNRYRQIAQEHGLKRVVIDSLTMVQTVPQVEREDALRIRYERIVNGLQRDGLTPLLIRELGTRDMPMIVTPEEYIADTIIHLEFRPVDHRRVRTLEILKHRGSAHSLIKHPFLIDVGGLQIFAPAPDALTEV